MKYTVWVGGTEVTDYVDRDTADEILMDYLDEGYDEKDVWIEEVATQIDRTKENIYEIKYTITLMDWLTVKAKSLEEARSLAEDWIAKSDVKKLDKFVISDAMGEITECYATGESEEDVVGLIISKDNLKQEVE
jgi:predicted RNase H-like HicB family nuclease